MAHAKSTAKRDRKQEFPSSPEEEFGPEEAGDDPIGDVADEPKEFQRVSAAAAAKVKKRLRQGHQDFYIPEEQETGNGNVSDQVKNNAKKAAGEVTQGPLRSRAGYVAPTRADKKTLLTYVTTDVHKAFKACLRRPKIEPLVGIAPTES